MKRKTGFTLIELLVVVGIITLLVAILFPVFLSAREKARSTACLSNYHQIGLAIHMYANDYDGNTPPNGGSFSGLIVDCAPYTRTNAVFICPDDFDRETEGRAGSYRMATAYQGLPVTCGWQDPYYDIVAEPSTTTLAYEAEKDDALSPLKTTFRHHGGTQILMFDTHTLWVPGVSAPDGDG